MLVVAAKADPLRASTRLTTAVPELTFGKLCFANTDLIVG
jgi:hypothetical protein